MRFHRYRINEIYSNADGTIQFIELANGPENREGFWGGQSIRVTHQGSTHTFTFPTDLPSQTTANTTVLLATQAFADLGLVKPEFTLPSGFLFTDGGTLNFANVDLVSYGALALDGTTSVDRNGAASTHSPRNFAGVASSVTKVGPPTSNGPTPGNDTIVLGGGNDSLPGSADSDSIDGGSGLDTVLYGGAHSSYSRAYAGAGWTQMDKGMDLVEVAAPFIDSAEFRSRYGTNPTTTEFVEYHAQVVGSPPPQTDPPGYSYGG